jgi:hypothetical protein
VKIPPTGGGGQTSTCSGRNHLQGDCRFVHTLRKYPHANYSSQAWADSAKGKEWSAKGFTELS